MPRRADRPDIEAGATVRAKKLRFGREPESDVRWAGDARSATERENLPPDVEPGVTYRDVEVRSYAEARVAVRLHDEIRKKEGPPSS